MSPFVVALWGIVCAAGGYACGYLVGRMDKLEAKLKAKNGFPQEEKNT